ncbi:xylan 1,4-beta-xylosidase [Rossellomorea marisflavi]
MPKTIITNPVLPGFHPDPSLLRVKDTYYIAVSTFEWLPGVRIYESRNLVNWQHKSDPLTDQVDLSGNPKSGSIWAPQISYSDGLYYLVYTDVKSTRRPFKDSHNYVITAPDLSGPWSDPVYLNSSGFDPSLFHDDDGKTWLLNEIWDYRMTTGNKSAGIVLQEYDRTRQVLTGPVHKVFDGTELAKTEAPHLYRHNGYYYLITAEGGTGSGHAITVCRSRAITGPYEVDPKYPMLTARDKPESPLQCAGHGSIIQSPEGNWYMAYLCTRPLGGSGAILGRETAIQEVTWSEDGWLKLADGGNGPSLQTAIETKEPVRQVKPTDFHDEFQGDLHKEWNTLRIPQDPSWCDLTSREGTLRLWSGGSPHSLFDHHIVAVRQKDFFYEAETRIEYEPETFNQLAGLMLYLDDENYLYCYLTQDESGRVLRLLSCDGGESTLHPVMIDLGDGAIDLKVEGLGSEARFYYRSNAEWLPVADAIPVHFLSGGFTGTYIGIAVHDMDTQSGSHADFHHFTYRGKDEARGIGESGEWMVNFNDS